MNRVMEMPHGLAVHVDGPPDFEQLRAAIGVLAGPSADARITVEALPFGRHTSEAHAWLRRETERELDRAGGQHVRMVAAEFADGWAVVAVADRTVADRAVLARLSSGRPVEKPVPTRAQHADDESSVPAAALQLGIGWDSVRYLAHRSTPRRIHLERRITGTDDPVRQRQAASAAVAAVLARYASTSSVIVGFLLDGTAAIALHRIPGDEPDLSVRDLLAASDPVGPGTVRPNAKPVGTARLDTVLIVEDRVDTALEEHRVHYHPGYFDHFAMTVHVEHTDARVRLSFCATDEVVTVAALDQFATDVAAFCGELLGSTGDAKVGEIELAAAVRPVIVPPPAPAAMSVYQAIGGHATGNPDAVAVVDGTERLTYRELYARSGRIAAGLRARGVVPDDRVAVCLPRSAELVVALLGVLRAGATYVPIDPEWPADRLHYVLDDANPRLLIQASTAQTAGFTIAELESNSDTAPEPFDDPARAAYVIYTSGSTGRPKGVAVPLGNIMQLVGAGVRQFAFDSGDTWSFFHSAAFDYSVWEIWGCLATGGRLVVVPYFTAKSPSELWELIRREQVTVLSQTPAAFAQLVAAAEREPARSALRLIVSGGAALDLAPVCRWFDLVPERQCQFVNMYGITETTVHVTAEVLSRNTVRAHPRAVGLPLPGWGIEIRDSAGRRVPPLVKGEIWVSGVGLAQGYLNRPELTAERFVVDPRSAIRYYRSGDLGRFLPDGRVEHWGRIDNQVKVRGYRIELDEIQVVLSEMPGAASVVVVAQDENASGDLRIHAYLAGGSVPDPVDIRRWATQRLPAYMVPATFSVVDAFPLTPNGKVDIDALRESAATTTRAHAEWAPSTDREAERSVRDIASVVRNIWADLFDVEVDGDADFFDLGGNSLLAVTTSRRLEDSGLAALPVRELYRAPTPSAIARYYATIMETAS
ncbi:non-ribosomal peptide synthetase [Nocardia sp. MW-W600-9]